MAISNVLHELLFSPSNSVIAKYPHQFKSRLRDPAVTTAMLALAGTAVSKTALILLANHSILLILVLDSLCSRGVARRQLQANPLHFRYIPEHLRRSRQTDTQN
jgi:hypothetical protein